MKKLFTSFNRFYKITKYKFLAERSRWSGEALGLVLAGLCLKTAMVLYNIMSITYCDLGLGNECRFSIHRHCPTRICIKAAMMAADANMPKVFFINNVDRPEQKLTVVLKKPSR